MQINRLFHMISFYNMMLAYACFFVIKSSSMIYQTVAANALFIAMGVTIYYGYHGYQSPKLFYDKLFFPLPLSVWYIVDFFVHFAPLALLGITRSPVAYAASATIILIWYSWIRTKTTYVYGITTHAMDKVVYKYGVVLAAMIIFASTRFQ